MCEATNAELRFENIVSEMAKSKEREKAVCGVMLKVHTELW